ncbi:hypothetical protein HID58_059670 [Brassica napus]|uniref:Transposase MuDR plant domain-containing protein n=1 Tax=Brassica napus TaxID=3708 RepID=A0ABQ7ZTJ5_BRANA|nr:hypothetical protein HID58_059670 [Brassica napus]
MAINDWSKKGYRTRELEAANFTHRGMSCIRYGEGGKGMADGGCSVSSIEGVHDSYIVVISGRWIMYDTGDWDFKLDSDRMGRAVYAKLITSVEDLKRAIIESYGLVGMYVAVEMSYWLGEHGSCAVGEREAPVQISKDKDFDLFTSARKVDKYINVFVTFKEEIDGKIHFLRPMGNLLKSKEVASSNEMQVGSTSADVHTRNEVNDGETDLTEDEIILMGVAEIEVVYASNGFGMHEVDGTACEVQNKVETTEDATLGEGEDADDEDYDYNLWHDFVGRNCEWDDDKDEDGGVGGGGRTNVTYGGVRGEVVTKTRSGRTNPSSNKGSGSSTNKQRTANPPSTFEDYVDEGRDYIGSSRISMENIEEASNNLGVKSSDQVADTENHSDPNQEEDPSLDNSSQMLVLQTPPKPFNMHTREVDDSDDFVGQVPQCVSSRPTHDTSDGEDEDDDFVEPVPQCISGGQTHETLVGEDEDDDFIKPVPQSRSREEDTRRRREKDKADDESLMKSVRAVELYGFEDVEASSNNEAVNDYTVDDIDFTLADADMYTGKLFSSKQEFKISLHIYALKQVFRFKFHKHAFNYRNVDAKFKKRNQKQMVGRAAEVFKVSHFKRLYAEIKLTDKRCWDYLEKIDPRHWTRSHFEGERYNLMSSNIAESLNKALVHARDSPIMAQFEFIRRMISRWFVSRQQKISKMSGEIPPAVDELMENNLEDARAYAEGQKKKKLNTCSRCHISGHNKKSCKEPLQ